MMLVHLIRSGHYRVMAIEMCARALGPSLSRRAGHVQAVVLPVFLFLVSMWLPSQRHPLLVSPPRYSAPTETFTF